jgi:hypothetical protein
MDDVAKRPFTVEVPEVRELPCTLKNAPGEVVPTPLFIAVEVAMNELMVVEPIKRELPHTVSIWFDVVEVRPIIVWNLAPAALSSVVVAGCMLPFS